MPKNIGVKAFENKLSEYLKVTLPSGSITAFAGSSAPDDWLICDGRAISRTIYSDLFSAIGTTHGSGDGSTTFNLPDYRGTFLRGRVNISTFTGSGTASLNQATFTNHGINRTGFRIRLSSGTLSGLAASTDYFAIVVDANTLAFATTQANALSNTRTAISGANSAVIVQWEDPDAANRIAMNTGGNTGNAVGSVQTDGFASHNHIEGFAGVNSNASYGVTTAPSGNINTQSGTNTANHPFTSSTGGNETRPKNVYINYIIKI